jgi:hypothetical protein
MNPTCTTSDIPSSIPSSSHVYSITLTVDDPIVIKNGPVGSDTFTLLPAAPFREGRTIQTSMAQSMGQEVIGPVFILMEVFLLM